MSVLKWDQNTEKVYQTGISKVVLFPMNVSTGAYENGVAWNGITSVSESPSGGEANDIYADNVKWLSIRGNEQYSGSIGAFMYPKEFAACNGETYFGGAVKVAQQTRKPFGLCYRTEVGNDTSGLDYGYKLHFIYHATINPSGAEYSTINESADPMEMSWDFDTIKEEIKVKDASGNLVSIKPSSTVTVDTTLLTDDQKEILKTLEAKIYGTDAVEGGAAATDSTLPSISEIIAMFDPNLTAV